MSNTTAITTAEQEALAQLETTIERGLSTFLEVGEALWKIREGKLYRQHHKTFEAYCQKKWGIGKARAYQLMNAAETVKSLPCERSTIVDKITTESQARELAKVPADERPKVLQRALAEGDGKLTATAIARAAKPAPSDDPAPSPSGATNQTLTEDMQEELAEQSALLNIHLKACLPHLFQIIAPMRNTADIDEYAIAEILTLIARYRPGMNIKWREPAGRRPNLLSVDALLQSQIDAHQSLSKLI